MSTPQPNISSTLSHKIPLTLYHYWRSSCSWRVRWALALKKIPVEFIPVNLLTDETESTEQRKRNPLGYVPVLEVMNDSSSYRFLGESMAIIEWLEEIYPHPSLLPGTPLQRARIRQLSEIINAGTQPLQNLNVTHFYSTLAEEQKKWSIHWITTGLSAYETLVKSTAGRFSVGDTLTLADLYLIPQCYNARRNGLSMEPFPSIQKIEAAALETESCQKSHPDRFQP